MLHITMPLSTNDLSGKSQDLHPVAAVQVEAQGRRKYVNIQLQGAIADESTASLLEFLKAVSNFVGTRWTLQMKDLRELSMPGVQHLVEFAETLRERGHRLEVCGVHCNVYATLKELKLVRAFAWPV